MAMEVLWFKTASQTRGQGKLTSLIPHGILHHLKKEVCATCNHFRIILDSGILLYNHRERSEYYVNIMPWILTYWRSDQQLLRIMWAFSNFISYLIADTVIAIQANNRPHSWNESRMDLCVNCEWSEMYTFWLSWKRLVFQNTCSVKRKTSSIPDL